MENNRVTRFNTIVGNAPAGTRLEIMAQIARQCSFLLEEVNETMKAATENDIVEVADGIADVEYVAAYLKTLIKALGVDQEAVFNAVCDNNDEKFTTSDELALCWVAEKEYPTFISEVEYEGVKYLTVRRESDSKVTKYDGFPKVDLTPFLPKE